MKLSFYVSLFCFFLLSTEVNANCPNNVTQSRVNLLSGNTVCATKNNEKWQEFHNTNGDLIDYKLGPNDPVDPSVKVGNWSVSNGIVTYNYGSGGVYTYTVGGGNSINGSHDFCDVTGTTILVSGATIKGGSGPCQ